MVQAIFPSFLPQYFFELVAEIRAQAALFFITLALRALFRARAVSGSWTQG